MNLAEGSTIYADKQYNDYHYEDLMEEAASIRMRPLRKKNSKRPFAPFVEYIQQRMWVCPVSTDCLPLSHSTSSQSNFFVLCGA